jgi:hypothetical protein
MPIKIYTPIWWKDLRDFELFLEWQISAKNQPPELQLDPFLLLGAAPFLLERRRFAQCQPLDRFPLLGDDRQQPPRPL